MIGSSLSRATSETDAYSETVPCVIQFAVESPFQTFECCRSAAMTGVLTNDLFCGLRALPRNDTEKSAKSWDAI